MSETSLFGEAIDRDGTSEGVASAWWRVRMVTEEAKRIYKDRAATACNALRLLAMA